MNKASLQQRINCVYTPIEDAIVQMNERRKNTTLLKTIESDLAFPSYLKKLFDKPRIVMFKHIAAPINEFVRVLSVAKKHNLEFVVIEYLEDIFTPSINRDKYILARLPIYNGTDSNSNGIIRNINIVDFPKMEGRPFSTIQTHKKEFLPELQHWLLQESMDWDYKQYAFDASTWLMSHKGPKEYYKQLFKLFIAHSILAEVYYADGIEEYFSSEVILPAIEDVSNEYGIKPLIWNHVEGTEDLQHSFWDCYPKHVGDLLKEKGYY